jgi:nucleotide-binding universal stress UspA family protein
VRRIIRTLAIPKVILAAVSFSAASRVALGLAAFLAQQYGADLCVLHVEDPLLLAAADYLGFDLLMETREQLQCFIAEAWPVAVALPATYVVAGPAVDVILDVAHQSGADLVVVGQADMSGAERLVFESTADRLLERADLSVLVAPSAWQPPGFVEGN